MIAVSQFKLALSIHYRALVIGARDLVHQQRRKRLCTPPTEMVSSFPARIGRSLLDLQLPALELPFSPTDSEPEDLGGRPGAAANALLTSTDPFHNAPEDSSIVFLISLFASLRHKSWMGRKILFVTMILTGLTMIWGWGMFSFQRPASDTFCVALYQLPSVLYLLAACLMDIGIRAEGNAGEGKTQEQKKKESGKVQEESQASTKSTPTVTVTSTSSMSFRGKNSLFRTSPVIFQRPTATFSLLVLTFIASASLGWVYPYLIKWNVPLKFSNAGFHVWLGGLWGLQAWIVGEKFLV